MAKLSAQEFADKWGSRTSAATADFKRGVERVTESPTAKAAGKLDKMRANFNAAIDSGKVKRGLEGVSLADWKGVTATKGVSNIPSGVAAAKAKVQKVAGALLSHIDAGVDEVSKMADVTLEDGIARSAAMIRHMAGFQKPA